MCAQLTSGQLRRNNQEYEELNRKYNDLTEHIAVLDKELGLELDGERRLVLEKKLADRRAERNDVAARMSEIEAELRDSPLPPPDSSDRPPDDPAAERTGPRSRWPLVAVLGIVGLVMLVVLGVIVYDQINPAQKSVTPTAQKETPTPRPLQTLSTDGAACDLETNLVPKDWPVILMDDFSSNRNNWTTEETRSPGYEYDFSFGDNDYVGTGNWTIDDRWHYSIPDNSKPANQDFYAAVDLTLDEGPGMLNFGIMFRNQPTAAGGTFGSHIRVGLQGNGSFVQLVRREDEDRPPTEWPVSPKIDSNVKHRLSLMGLGNDIYIWLDGQCIATWPDHRDDVPIGTIGLFFGLPWGSPATATVRFDNFEVRAP